MNAWTKTFGLLFLAAASVYSDQADAAGPAKSVSTTGNVKVLDETNDPFAANSSTSQTPAVVPTATESTTTTTSASTEGVSVSSAQVNISDAGTVEIHVNDANLVEVLRMLSLQSQKNIIASKDVRGTVTANLYDVTVREALDAILHANGYAYREQGNFIYVYTVAELQKIVESERKATTEVFRLFYTPAANAVNMIKPVLSPDAQVSFTTPPVSGLESGTGDMGGNSHAIEDIIVITDYQDNLDRVRNILKEVDRRPQQILIEATILRASLSEDNALGIDFTVLGGVDFASLTGVGSSASQILNGSITGNPAASGIVDKGAGSASTGFTGPLPQGGLRVGIVQNNIAVFLTALESVTDTVVLANPKVLALNKQRGEVIVGRKDGYLTTTFTESTSVQTVEFLDTGTRLIFRPYIGDDNFIRMEIHPEDSSGGLTGANLPFKITTEVTSNVMVKDGHTIVIGGLFRESSDTARGQVPFLGNLPLAGPLFRNQRDRTTREEVIILLTPHIVQDESAYSEESEKMLKKMEQLRVGVRQGMMPFGRERLAESSYEAAVNEMAKPNPNRQTALWHLNCATNLNPKFIEAIELKEQITGKEVSAVDSSAIRGFVRRQILKDLTGNGAPTTMPSEDVDLNLNSATQPSAMAPASTTQPSDGANTQAAAVPATQPVASDANDVQTTESVEDPAVGKTFWESLVVVEHKDDEHVEQTATPAPMNNPATTLPTHGEVNAPGFTVTELPIEEQGNSEPEVQK